MVTRQHYNMTDEAIRKKFERPHLSVEEQQVFKDIETFFADTAINISEFLEHGRYKNMMLTSLEEAMHWAIRSKEAELLDGED